MNFPITHGITIAPNGYIKNLVFESVLAADKDDFEAAATLAKAWYDVDSGRVKVKQAAGIDAFATLSDLTSQLKQLREELESSEGSQSIGTSNVHGAHDLFTIVGDPEDDSVVLTVSKAIQDIVNGIDQNIFTAKTFREDLADTTGGEGKGASLIGMPAITVTNERFATEAGNLQDVLANLASGIDNNIQSEANRVDINFLNKTTTEEQNITAKITFNNNISISENLTVQKDIKITGKLIQQGEVLTIQGKQVLFDDNFVYLNSNFPEDQDPVADAGWGVNRGTAGNTEIVKWIEDDKALNVLTTWVKKGFYTEDASDGSHFAGDDDGTSENVFEMSRAVGYNEFKWRADKVDASLIGLKTKVGNSIGDLDKLKTEAKENLVVAINEVHDENDDRFAQLASTSETGSEEGDPILGTRKVGYRGKTGNKQFNIAAGTLESTLDTLVTATDSDRQEFIDRVELLASADGSKEIGTANVAGSNNQFSINSSSDDTPLTVAEALSSIVQGIDDNKQGLEDTNTALTNVVNNINANKATFASSEAAKTHTFSHNLNSEIINVTVWVLESTDDGDKWQNSVVATTIMDANTIKVELSKDKNVRIIAEKVIDVSTTYTG